MNDSHWFLAGGGVCGALARSIDWASTPLGPPATWPHSLRATLATMFHARQPMFLWWGPELIQFYNDAYLPSFGQGKHPAAMGQAGRACWQEIWPIIWPQIDDVMSRAHASWNEDQLVPILRNGRLEEVFWTYSYTPVFGEDGDVAATLVICTETTARVVAERRIGLLGSLVGALAAIERPNALIDCAVSVLASSRADVPFAAFYKRHVASNALTAVQSCNLSQAAAGAIASHLSASYQIAPGAHVVSLAAMPDGFDGSPWPERCTDALVICLVSSAPGSADLLVLGLSPRLPFDEPYRRFMAQIVEQIETTSRRLEASRLRALAEAERNNLLEQAPVATALLSGPHHLFVLANPLYHQMVGRDDLVGKTYLQAFPELADAPILGILDQVFQTGEPYVTNELMIPFDRAGSGAVEDCFFKFNLEPMRDAGGAVYGMMAVAVDITELVTARRVLERSNAEREGLLRDLESASRAKDEFLAMLGHELRNPLSPIVTALQLLRLRSDGRTSKAEEIIQRQVEHLVRLVDDLLDVAKITRGKLELRVQKVDVAEAITKGIEIASYLLEKQGQSLEIHVPRHELFCLGDSVRLSQIFANLLTNAARYSPMGSRIELRAARDGDVLLVSVKDFGIGIPTEMLGHVFDLFVQAKRSADRAEGGLGIGLALVKNLVALHGGTTWATSAGPGQGSEFFVRLPALAEVSAGTPVTAVSAGAAGPVGAPRSASQRILLVDDNIDAVELLRDFLVDCGHEVALAVDPLTAIELARQFSPQIAVLDIGLPVMDGYELAGRLRSDELTRSCRLIALSGYGQQNDRERSARAGFERHLVKPVDVERLAEIIVDQARP